jgi:hypothetical protein
MRSELRYVAKLALWKVAPWTFSLRPLVGGRDYSIAIYGGKTPFELRPDGRARNPALTCTDIKDVPAATVADPFMCWLHGRWHMFFEVLNRLSQRGEIALATSEDARRWQYQRVVLHEPFHLSYPQVFPWEGEFYMIPETGRSDSVRVYRATRFPLRWRHVATLLEGGRFVDTSVLYFEGRWWMFTDAGQNEADPILRLFWARRLLGPWEEHPSSPIAEDVLTARPAGRVILYEGRPVRFAQGGHPVYGTDVRAFEILELSPTRYRERPIGPIPVLGPGEQRWNRGGMHHIDAHAVPDGTWIACVDGWRERTENVAKEAFELSDNLLP